MTNRLRYWHERIEEFFVGRLIASLTRRERAALPTVDWTTLLAQIRMEIHGYPVFLEARDGRLLSVEDRLHQTDTVDIVGLVVACVREDVRPWDTERLARRLADQLAHRQDFEVVVLLSRDPTTFVGYFVRLRPVGAD